MKTQQPELTARTSQPSVPLPTTDVLADETSPNPLVSLSVDERFLLKLLLPQQGNRRAMAIAAAIDALISFDEGEAIHYGIRMSDDGNLFFNRNGMTDFPFDSEQVALIKQAVEVADGESRITREMLSLLEKIDSL